MPWPCQFSLLDQRLPIESLSGPTLIIRNVFESLIQTIDLTLVPNFWPGKQRCKKRHHYTVEAHMRWPNFKFFLVGKRCQRGCRCQEAQTSDFHVMGMYYYHAVVFTTVSLPLENRRCVYYTRVWLLGGRTPRANPMWKVNKRLISVKIVDTSFSGFRSGTMSQKCPSSDFKRMFDHKLREEVAREIFFILNFWQIILLLCWKKYFCYCMQKWSLTTKDKKITELTLEK